jgi:O-acetyl-ADP-ribose deacetylase (regulator of RNase III)
VGGWGRGFVLALSRRWPEPERRYRAWYRGEEELPFALGEVQFVCVEENLWVANLIGQHGLNRRADVPPVRYEAIRAGLGRVADFAHKENASVHMPRIGCGLAGGEWHVVERIIQEELTASGVAVTVYELPEEART